MKLKKVASVLLAASMTMGLVACGNTTTEAPAAETPAAETTATEVAEAESTEAAEEETYDFGGVTVKAFGSE